jgi:hypothetical protein
MADSVGLEACKQAYQAAIASCNSILIAKLATAATDDDKQVALDEFKQGIHLCKEAFQYCQDAFN